jgi:hypothetical protein
LAVRHVADAAGLGKALTKHAEICVHVHYMRSWGRGCKLDWLRPLTYEQVRVILDISKIDQNRQWRRRANQRPAAGSHG